MIIHYIVTKLDRGVGTKKTTDIDALALVRTAGKRQVIRDVMEARIGSIERCFGSVDIGSLEISFWSFIISKDTGAVTFIC